MLSGEKKNDVAIVKHVAVLKEARNGWTQELNLVSWYGKEPKYDIRWWSKDKGNGGKGATLGHGELEKLKEAIESLPEFA